MGSVGNQNPWAPYNTYKDCSPGICSIYCPQWCYMIFPPPPPFSLGDDNSDTDFSPLIIAVIGILASAFVLISYYTIISKYCRRRRHGDSSNEFNENHDQMTNEGWQGNSSGLDEAIIKSITVCKYKKGDGFIEDKDCAVCLSEFQENESLRILPKCNHAFHLPCIDTWLKSQASCPLCRSNIASINILPPASQAPAALPIQENPAGMSTNVSASFQYQHRINDAVLVIQDFEGRVRHEAVVSHAVGGDNNRPKVPIQDTESMQNMEESDIRLDLMIQPIRRSASLNFSGFQSHVSIADILHINEDDDDDDDDDEYQLRDSEKNKNGVLNLVKGTPLGLKRSTSTGRFMFARYEKGRSSTIPN